MFYPWGVHQSGSGYMQHTQICSPAASCLPVQVSTHKVQSVLLVTTLDGLWWILKTPKHDSAPPGRGSRCDVIRLKLLRVCTSTHVNLAMFIHVYKLMWGRWCQVYIQCYDSTFLCSKSPPPCLRLDMIHKFPLAHFQKLFFNKQDCSQGIFLSFLRLNQVHQSPS